MEIKEIEFADLRSAYITVRTFVEGESCQKIKSLRIRVAQDLGLLGDDNYELLEKFVTRFELGLGNFDYSGHFHSEGELSGSVTFFLGMVVSLIWLPLKAINLLTFNSLKINEPGLFLPPRKVTDLTFRDLLTWYIEKEYKPGDSVRYTYRQTNLL